MEIQAFAVNLDELPDAFVLGGRHINGKDGSLILAMTPRARKAIGDQCVQCDDFTIATFIPMDYICQLKAILESEGLELSEL